jgi:hypothetical protein
MESFAPPATNGTHKYMQTGACCKHYAGVSERGMTRIHPRLLLAAYDLEDDPQQRYFFSANVTTRNLWETYLPVSHSFLFEIS